MGENFPTMSGKGRFLQVYEMELLHQVKTEPGRYVYGEDRVAAIAIRAVESIGLGMAIMGDAAKETCKVLGIKPTIRAAAEFIRHG